MPPRRRRRSDTGDRAVLYLRQSVLKEESVSIEQQEAACREHCRRHGYTIVADPYVDEGVSASKVRLAKRENVQRALREIDEGRADVLVAWKGSRVARNRLDAEIAKERVAEAGGRIESATEPNEQSASGKFATGMLAEVAAFEAARIGEDWKATHARRRKEGLPAQGGRRYGYDRVYNDRNKVIGYRINDAEASVLRWMYRQVIDGHGAPYIARELNRRGIVNPIGRTWPQVGVYTLLDSGFAAGLIVWRERRSSDGRPKGDRVYSDGAHDPIIDQDTWRKYQAARRRSSYQPPRAKEAQYRLSSLVRCGDCGSQMWPTSGSRGGTGKGMVCGRWQSRGEGRCVTAVTSKIEDAVKGWLAEMVDKLEDQAEANAATERLIASARRDEKTALRTVASVEGKLAKLNRAWLEGMIPDQGYTTTRDELLAEYEAAKRDVEAAQDEVLLRRVPSRDDALTVLEQWETLPVATIRTVLSLLIDRVVVYPPAKRYHKTTVQIISAFDEHE